MALPRQTLDAQRVAALRAQVSALIDRPASYPVEAETTERQAGNEELSVRHGTPCSNRQKTDADPRRLGTMAALKHASGDLAFTACNLARNGSCPG